MDRGGQGRRVASEGNGRAMDSGRALSDSHGHDKSHFMLWAKSEESLHIPRLAKCGKSNAAPPWWLRRPCHMTMVGLGGMFSPESHCIQGNDSALQAAYWIEKEKSLSAPGAVPSLTVVGRKANYKHWAMIPDWTGRSGKKKFSVRLAARAGGLIGGQWKRAKKKKS